MFCSNNSSPQVSSSSTCGQLTCRAALVLNNIGVSLLEQGKTLDGISTFGDSIYAMKHALLWHEQQQDLSSIEGNTLTNMKTIDSLIASANARLIQASAARRLPQDTNNNNSTNHDSNVSSVCPIDDDLTGITAALKEAVRSTTSSACISPVRFRHNDDPHDEPDFDLLSAIVLYNNGQAHFSAVSIFKNKKTMSARHLQAASTSFSMAQSLLINHLHNCDGVTTLEFMGYQLLALVLTNLLRVNQHQGLMQHAAAVGESLTEVLELVKDYEDRITSMNVIVGNHIFAPAA